MNDAQTPNDEFELALETSTALGGVAVGRGDDVLAVRTFRSPRMHAGDLLPTVDALCRECHVTAADLRCVYVSIGPGSFTGLRIGVTAARMMAWALKTRIFGVPTLDVMAQNALLAEVPPATVAVFLDAKRGRVYAAAYDRQSQFYKALAPASEVEPKAFLTGLPRSGAVLGEGTNIHRTAVETAGWTILPEALHAPRPEVLYRLGRSRRDTVTTEDPRRLIPMYVRAPEPEEKWRSAGVG